MIKVVIAEDDFRIAQVQEQFLQKVPGVEVVDKALNAKETMEILSENEVDLLFLDIYMPDELGTNLLSKIRGNYPTIDIIMVTAATEKTMLETAVRYGVTNYLLKPVTMEKFVEAVEDYKRKKKLLSHSNEVDQTLIDRYFGNANQSTVSQKDLPSGVDRHTLDKVKRVMEELDGGISIEEMGEKIGASRTTARRYLEYLVSIDVCRAKHEYGVVGRPERKYYYNS
ncbi:CitB family two-component system response regulator CitT [Lysinibacillus composti]|uniref:Response regulator n=1 Tax=Lysinibacillus composti TaxID=720633 RepID=A0A3N9UBH1_9BACI|nr:response regulator [Lysinibacillus composti]MBM7610627.1 CitB family two-component system response regulator CitT [Lysinibacillus composti]RQW73758.1 response regulator [Lysinibacillus composti]